MGNQQNNRDVDVERVKAKLRPLALLAAGSTGADIERIVRELAQNARRNKKRMTFVDVEAALNGNRPSMPDELRWRVAIHEAGHAVTWTLFDIGEVDLVTIGTGNGGSGFVSGNIRLPTLQDSDWVKRMIACELAGRAAELLVFGNALAGSGGGETSDLANATERATSAETVLGFSDHQPLLYRRAGPTLELLSLDGNLRNRVNSRLEAAMASAQEVLTGYHHVLLDVARALCEKNVLEGDEVRSIISAGMTSREGSAIPK